MSDCTTLEPSRPMRPAQPATFEDRILGAAADILDAGIIADYNINNIALRAGVGISTLYDRFPGKKDAITWALHGIETSKALALVPENRDGRNAAWEMWAIVWGVVDLGLRRPTMTRLLLLERTRLSTLAKGEGGPDLLRSRIERCLLSGEYPDDARGPEVCSDVVTMIEGLVATACARRERDVGAVSHRVARAVLRYLGHPEAP